MEKWCRKGQMTRSGKRWLAILLSVCMIGTLFPTTTLAEQTDTSNQETFDIITSWEWIDEEDILDQETGSLALPGASEEMPAYFDDVTAFLPTQILATVENTEDNEAEEEDEPITLEEWDCDNYPEEGAYQGSYTFTAALPNGYALSEEAEVLEVLVELGGAQMYDTVTCISYLDESGNTQTCESATEVTSEDGTWGTSGNATWYVVQGDVNINRPDNYIKVLGNVHLILTDNSSLSVTGSIIVRESDNSSLTIYGQSKPEMDGDGNLTSNTGKLSVSCQKTNYSGIGGGGVESSISNAGTITINGGIIEASAAAGGAGIGGGGKGNGGTITINGGMITATGGANGAGIGGGDGGAGGNITINGGTINARSGSYGAGIGGGDEGNGGTITIKGGDIKAYGGKYGAGIGGGYSSNGAAGNITISGGTVTAEGGTYGTGIGSGYLNSNGGNITISGGTVTAKGDTAKGYGIGFSNNSSDNTITISGGTVTAQGLFAISVNGGTFSTGENGTAVIFAEGNGINGYDTIDTSNLSGTIFNKGTGTVYGNQTLNSDLTIPANTTLNVPDGVTLTVSDGVKVTNKGKIKVDGTMDQASAERVLNNPPQYKVSVTDGYVNNIAPDSSSGDTKNYYSPYRYGITVVANSAPAGQGLIGWDVTGVTYTPQRTSPLLFSMPASVVSVKSKYAPKAPMPDISITTFTADKITIQALTATDTYGDAEYSIDGTNWQTSNTFTDLEADTTYIVRARYLGNDNYAESDAGSKDVKTKKWAEEITEPTGLTATYGQKLEDIEFEEGSGWSWKEPTTAVSLNESEYEAQFAPADTADYDYSKLTGYRLDAGTVYIDRKLSVEVSKATPTLCWSGEAASQKVAYTGSEIATGKLTAPTVTLVNSETYTDTINYAYRAQGSSATFTSGLPTERGTYEVKASIDESGNYKAAETTSTMTLTIDWLNTDAAAVLTDQKNATLSGDGWWAQSVTFTAPTGFTISNSLTGSYGTSFVYDTQTGADGTGVTYYLKNSDDEIAEKTATVRIDRTAPTWPADGGISIKNNWWKKFLSTISFGLFFKDSTLEVKASAADDLSGVSAYYYYVDDTGSTTVLSSDELANKTFTEVAGSGEQTLKSLSSEGSYVVYAYAVDNAGNKSDYVGTNGVVLDTTAPTISDITEPSKAALTLTDTSAKISFTGSEAGTCFYMISETAPASIDDFATSSVNDKGMTVWTAKDGVSSVEMTTEAKQITLSNLSPNTTYTLYLEAVDQAGNSSSVYSQTFTTCKTMPTIATNPTISGTYGQTVENMKLTPGTAKVGSSVITGTWAVTDSNKMDVPGVGTTDTYQVTFTPDASYNDIYDTVIVPVKPTVSKRAITVTADDKTKTYGQANPAFTYTIPEGALVSGDDNTALGITLTCAANASSPVKAGGYAITGTTNSANYQVTVIPGVLTITKATPTITASDYTKTYGDIKFFLDATDNSAEANLQYAVTESKDPSDSVVEKDAVVTVDARGYVTITGAGTAKITASLPETANYKAASETITIVVNQATYPPNRPGTEMFVSKSCTYVRDIPLFGDWEWQNGDTVLIESRENGATAVYIGADKANYANTTADVSIIKRSDCEHVAGEILYTVNGDYAPTCTENGRGHRECTICGELIESGIIVSAAHSFSSTWTIDVQPTTTSEGSKSHHCTREGCDAKNDITVIPKLVISDGGGSGSSSSGSTTTETPAVEEPVVEAPATNKPNTTKKPAESKPDTEAPFIKGDNGKEGWDVIRDEVKGTTEGNTVVVDMNGASVVPGNVIADIRGKDITLVFDMGNGITWSINGKSITSDQIGDINFSVTVGSSNIPVDVINNVTGERYSQQISLAYDGEFGFTAVLSINMDKKNAGLFANLFYYNEGTGELEFICADEIAADGTAELTFTHASEYTIVVDTVPMDGSAQALEETEEEGTESEEATVTEAPKEKGGLPWWIILVCAIVIVAGVGVFFVVRKKTDDLDE